MPTVTLPKLRLFGLVVSVPAVTPDPDNGMLKEATLDVIAMFPLAAPAEAGLKPTVKLAL